MRLFKAGRLITFFAIKGWRLLEVDAYWCLGAYSNEYRNLLSYNHHTKRTCLVNLRQASYASTT